MDREEDSQNVHVCPQGGEGPKKLSTGFLDDPYYVLPSTLMSLLEVDYFIIFYNLTFSPIDDSY